MKRHFQLKQRNSHNPSISMAHFDSKARSIFSLLSFPNLSCLAAASHCSSCQCQYCTLPCWVSLTWQSGRRQSIMLPRLPSQCWPGDCSGCHRRTSMSFWLLISPSEAGQSLPGLFCQSENVIVAHGYGKENTEGKLASQNTVAKQDELETTVMSTILGVSTMDVHRTLEITSTCWSLCVCAFWMWIPHPVFQRRLQAQMCQQLPGWWGRRKISSLL